jgi:type VI secretion system protein ImpF
MPESSLTDRLQPALLDRLIDDEPDKQVESRDRRVVSVRQLREALQRDLAWLFNAKCLPPNDPIWNYPQAASSVLNYGMPDVTGLHGSDTRGRSIQIAMRAAIERFEPRILRSTLDVVTTMDASPANLGHLYVTEITAEACPVPIPEPLFIRTDVDLESGECRVRGRGHG